MQQWLANVALPILTTILTTSTLVLKISPLYSLKLGR
jgi:hypothetical protein